MTTYNKLKDYLKNLNKLLIEGGEQNISLEDRQKLIVLIKFIQRLIEEHEEQFLNDLDIDEPLRKYNMLMKFLGAIALMLKMLNSNCTLTLYRTHAEPVIKKTEIIINYFNPTEPDGDGESTSEEKIELTPTPKPAKPMQLKP
jgi:hypothetical protein|tara:strand:- start:2103 stop:2531 length:429 start_codon:yes stop_codon:yes gene_type:complete